MNSISPRELHRLISEGKPAELLDIRTAPDFARVHVSGARVVPLVSLNAAEFVRQRGGDPRPLYVFCEGGITARKAIQDLQGAGFDGGVLVEGGMRAWIAEGLPVERGQSRVPPLIQQVQIVVGSVTAVGAVLALTVDPRFAVIPLLMGGGLLFAGLTGMCGLAFVLARMPWNRGPGCACPKQATSKYPPA